MPKLDRLSFFFVTVFLFFIFHFSFFISRVNAATSPIPPNAPIACDKTGDPEFHSLRPYQASPCVSTTAPLAQFCGNNLTLKDEIKETYLGPAANCSYVDGKIRCDYNEHIEKPITINLDGAELPIMGNTEDVINSQSTGSAEPLDDAAKVNEYVSWYLNGTGHKAEYGSDKITGSDLINFSGPINKLLPGVILDEQRIKTIENATQDPKINHNQIVVCTSGNSKPVGCYDSNTHTNSYRLSDWTGSLSWFNTVANLFGNITDSIVSILPFVNRGDISASIADHWNLRTPPRPWDDGTGNAFRSNLLYEKAYNEWRGKTCIIIPGINKLICIDNVFVPNKFSDLFAYIPLSTTEDLEGSISVNNISTSNAPNADGVVVTNTKFSNQAPATLFFAHMAENTELSKVLQTTYLNKGNGGGGSPTTVDETPSCKSLEVRTNEGDNLFASKIEGTLIYDAKFSCKFNTTTTTDSGLCVSDCIQTGRSELVCKNLCDEALTVQDCKKEVSINLSTSTFVPKADEIWSRLVAGDSSVFKKIAPKIGPDAPISCLLDIPASTNITYSGTQVGNTTAELKLPHIGGVSEYFLKGIQSFLRPKGYGEHIATGGVCVNTGTNTGQCKQWLFQKDSSGTFYYDKIIAAASSASCNGKSLNPFWAIGIALNENGGLMSDNVNGDSNSHFGCNLSQIQTIDQKTSCMINTLRNDCLAGKTDDQTLREYGYRPGNPLWPITVLDPGGNYPPPLFGSGFNVTQLLSNLLATDWVAVYGSQAPTFCPNSPNLGN